MTPVSIAFLQLTDAAPLIVARERGFADAEGINLTLVRTTSWATLRDRLVYGQVQAAQMLAPLAVAVTLGLSQQPAALAAPCKLNVNGNMVVMSGEFAAALAPDLGQRLDDPLGTAHDFAAAIGLFRRKPVIGIVHRFSSHALMLRYWLASAGIDPDRDVVLRVLPPSLMVEAMRVGETDGFVAGEPWGSVAVEAGLAEAVAIGERIWRRGVEKVLTFRQDWLEANGDAVDRLVRAFAAAKARTSRSTASPFASSQSCRNVSTFSTPRRQIRSPIATASARPASTATLPHGSPATKPSVSPTRIASTISDGGRTRSTTSRSGSIPALASQ